MPMFEYECERHGRFEALLLRLPDEDYYACPVCDLPAPLVCSLPVMRPDSNWHFGEEIKGHGYLNSASQIARARRSEGLVEMNGRNDWEAMKKTAEDAREEWNDKLGRQNRLHFEKIIANSGVVDSFGELRPDTCRKLSDEPIKSTKDDRLG